jgi:iron uptake system component EfeO
VALTGAGCQPHSLAASAGPTTFHVSNEDAADVTEFEVLQGGRIMGEAEHVEPGTDRSFSLTLKPGTYATKCRGGDQPTGTLEVAAAGTGRTADRAARQHATDAYLSFVRAQAATLVAVAAPFADAVRAGDVARAKGLFAAARAPYERIEPVAESFGDLDPAIDAREGDVPAAEWGGFHRIEKALWADGSVAGMAPVADKLVADIASLRDRIASLSLEPSQVANGAVELLNEVSASKITGEEDRYSHTDLSDLAANVEGAKEAFVAVRSLLAAQDAALAATIDGRMADVQQALAKHAEPTGANGGYASFTTLAATDTRALATAVDALAEPLSRVAALVLQ